MANYVANLEIIKFSIYFYISLLIANYIIKNYQNDKKILLLEKLENKIICGKINCQQIQIEYATLMSGYEVSLWIKDKEDELGEKTKKFQLSSQKIICSSSNLI